MTEEKYPTGDIGYERICQACFHKHWNWKDCPYKVDWYHPKAIFFCSHQMIWLIASLPELKEFRWPVADYLDDNGVTKTLSYQANFETTSLFIAEVEIRLKTTGEAGEALVDEIQSGITEYEGLSRPAKRALNYISGFRRRRQTYPEWKHTQKKRGKLP